MINVAITEEEYAFYTGSLAPGDFDKSAILAQQIVDAHTLYAYVGRDLEKLPSLIRETYKQAVAVQTMAISQRGGVSGSSEESYSSVSIGRFSMAGKTSSSSTEGKEASNELVSPAAKALFPMLVSFGRGLQA